MGLSLSRLSSIAGPVRSAAAMPDAREIELTVPPFDLCRLNRDIALAQAEWTPHGAMDGLFPRVPDGKRVAKVQNRAG
jgi:hypothetical protein